MRFARITHLFIPLLLSALCAFGQSPSGNINGLVLDPANSLIVGAQIIAVNDVTGVQYTTRTNDAGVYVLPNLPPGPYRLQVSKMGFKTIIKPDITVSVQDALSINFTLPVGAAMETVTVKGGAPLVNTQSASVSTVIDRQFVANLPLNGRSFNTLLQLTPGVVIAPSSGMSTGQFSIAGQRTDANNFEVDGVSANFGVVALPVLGTSGTGSGQAMSALGGTSSLVSVEDLQEFRIETSSFAPEFGHAPGGQVVLTTRSGTNELHGGIYEYFRNDLMDANDWFANAAHQPRAPEKHNDFGGYFGGPLKRSRTFVFASYEGAYLHLPQTTVLQVPSISARQSAPLSLAPFLNGYPQPNGAQTADGSMAQFTGSYSNLASLNAGSLRIDHSLNDRATLFVRYSEAPSDTTQRVNSLSELQSTEVNTRTLTGGANLTFSANAAMSLRGNYSRQLSKLSAWMDSFGGATPPDAEILLGGLPQANNAGGFYAIGTNLYQSGPLASNRSTQVNVVDDLAITLGTHQLKFGGDYRVIQLDSHPNEHSVLYIASSVASFISSGHANITATSTHPGKILSQSLSLFGQDVWRITPRLSLTYGLRWELSPAPKPQGETDLASWLNTGNPADIVVASPGTPLWQTILHNFAPRFGLAYGLNRKGNFVLRLGGGIFYDLGLGSSANLVSRFPNFATLSSVSVPMPVADVSAYLPALSRQAPYQGNIEGFAPDLVLPRSYQWNLALEKSFEDKQAISATYVGQAGRGLLRQSALYRPNPNFFGEFLLTQNDAFSNYHALQLQYRRPLSKRLQAVLNYSWSHSLDNASNDVIAGLSNTVISASSDYSSSNFDVRHSFSGAALWEPPSVGTQGPLLQLTKGWSLDTVVVVRSGFPFNMQVFSTSPDPGGTVTSRPDVVPGQPKWISDPHAPAGKRLNAAAFRKPDTIRQGTESRNSIPGFGLAQVDLSFGRRFPIRDRFVLQFRTDAFNVFNHPNFTNPLGYLEFGATYLQSSQMLNHGLGGLSPLFQEGGPRSLQLSLKLTF